MKKISLLVVAIVLNLNFIVAQELALVRSDDKCGYINKSGKVVIEPQFEKAGDFSEGHAAAFKDDKWGYIDTSGKWVIQPTYDKVKTFSSGYTLVLKDDQWNYIDASGSALSTPVIEKYYDFDENGIAFYRVEKKLGLMGTNGKLVLEPTYDVIKPFVDGYARVRNDDKWGMISKTGSVFVPLEYDELSDYSSKAIWAKKGETFGIITNGNFSSVANTDKIWDFSNDSDLTYARNNKKVGFINTKGEWVIQPTYDKARAFNNGLAPVAKGKEWGYVNELGEEVIAPMFRDAETFSSDGLAPVKEKKLWGFIDKTGKMVIPAEYEITAGGFSLFSKNNLKGFKDGVARVKKGKEWGFIDKSGNPIGGKWYQNVENFSK